MSHYDTLGVPPNASADDIKRAYRKKAHQAHPDKGGSSEAFFPIALAYEVLGDRERRAHYDHTGESTQDDARTLALQELARLLLGLVEEADDQQVETCDLVGALRMGVAERERSTHNALVELNRSIKKRQRVLKRLVRKTPVGADVLADMVRHDIRSRERARQDGLQELQRLQLMASLASEYQYQLDNADVPEEFKRYFTRGA